MPPEAGRASPLALTLVPPLWRRPGAGWRGLWAALCHGLLHHLIASLFLRSRTLNVPNTYPLFLLFLGGFSLGEIRAFHMHITYQVLSNLGTFVCLPTDEESV